MQFSTAIISLVAMATSAFAQVSTTAAYDVTYDTETLSTLSLACSDGENGLNTKGYQTLGSIPGFTRVGAFETIAGWNSPTCGKCYQVTYAATGASIYVTAIDRATSGIVLSLAALDVLTGNNGKALGRVDVTYVEAAATSCGFPA
ncbi:Cerato-platanin [Tuber brumale]|nr:Cerato-platanin [Tuber brumale]